MNLFDKFLYKFAMAFFLLFALVGLDKFNIVSYDNVKTSMSSQFNFLNFVQKINGKTQLIILNTDDVVSVNGSLYKVENIENGKKIILDNYEAVENLVLGQVIKINKNDVYIQTTDGYIYCYKDLQNIDVHLYQIIRKNEIIGMANNDINNKYYYDLFMYKNNKIVTPII